MKHPFPSTLFLLLQVSYGLMGILFNLVSLGLNEPLTPTLPLAGIFVLAVYLAALIPGFMGSHRLYHWLMGFMALFLGYGGIFKHMVNLFNDPDTPMGYYNQIALFVAVAINLFGFVLNVCSLFYPRSKK